MTEVQNRMIECLRLRGLSARIQEAYVRAVPNWANTSTFHLTGSATKSCVITSAAQDIKHYSRNTMNLALCGSVERK